MNLLQTIVPEAPAASILWDVAEDHFDESEFLFGQWSRRLRSPLATMAQLASTLEKRLEAHLDALLIGGVDVSERLLIPELENHSQSRRATIAALVLLYDEDLRKRVIDTALARDTRSQPFLSRALILSSVESLDAELTERFQTAESDYEKAILLDVLNRRGVPIGSALDRCLESSDSRLATAAIESVQVFGRRDKKKEIERILSVNSVSLRAQATKAGVLIGSHMAWEACLDQVASEASSDSELEILAAVVGLGRDHELIFKNLGRSGKMERNLWVLGFCGTQAAAELCLKYLESPNLRMAKLAAESLAWMGGFKLTADEFQTTILEPSASETLPPLESENLDEEIKLDGVDDIPPPNVAAIRSWWTSHHETLAGDRLLAGNVLSVSSLIQGLQNGVMWRRAGLALQTSWLTRGQHYVQTDVFSSRQRRSIDSLNGMQLNVARWD